MGTARGHELWAFHRILNRPSQPYRYLSGNFQGGRFHVSVRAEKGVWVIQVCSYSVISSLYENRGRLRVGSAYFPSAYIDDGY